MKPRKSVTARWVLAIVYMVLGVSLLVCGQIGIVDEFWNGMGGALTFIGVLRIYQLVRYRSNTEYKEQVDTAVQDERNRFLSTKAWSWAGYLYIMVAAVATIVFKFLGNDTLMYAASGSVCLILVLYWVSYFIVRKKY